MISHYMDIDVIKFCCYCIRFGPMLESCYLSKGTWILMHNSIVISHNINAVNFHNVFNVDSATLVAKNGGYRV